MVFFWYFTHRFLNPLAVMRADFSLQLRCNYTVKIFWKLYVSYWLPPLKACNLLVNLHELNASVCARAGCPLCKFHAKFFCFAKIYYFCCNTTTLCFSWYISSRLRPQWCSRRFFLQKESPYFVGASLRFGFLYKSNIAKYQINNGEVLSSVRGVYRYWLFSLDILRSFFTCFFDNASICRHVSGCTPV